VAGVLVLTLNSGAYYSEIMRGGIQSIPKGQWEASESLGISRVKTFTRIIFPQAVRDAFPSIANQLVLLIFGTSVLSILDVRELTQTASILNSASFRSMEIFTFVMLFYYAVTALILALARLSYKKWFAAKTERR
jgi:ABC-type amino acid transport system permease subunit